MKGGQRRERRRPRAPRRDARSGDQRCGRARRRARRARPRSRARGRGRRARPVPAAARASPRESCRRPSPRWGGSARRRSRPAIRGRACGGGLPCQASATPATPSSARPAMTAHDKRERPGPTRAGGRHIRPAASTTPAASAIAVRLPVVTSTASSQRAPDGGGRARPNEPPRRQNPHPQSERARLDLRERRWVFERPAGPPCALDPARPRAGRGAASATRPHSALPAAITPTPPISSVRPRGVDQADPGQRSRWPHSRRARRPSGASARPARRSRPRTAWPQDRGARPGPRRAESGAPCAHRGDQPTQQSRARSPATTAKPTRESAVNPPFHATASPAATSAAARECSRSSSEWRQPVASAWRFAFTFRRVWRAWT